MPVIEGTVTTKDWKQSDKGVYTYWIKMNNQDRAYFTFEREVFQAIREHSQGVLEFTQKGPDDKYPKIKAWTEKKEPVQQTLPPAAPGTAAQPNAVPSYEQQQNSKNAVMARMSAFRGLCELSANMTSAASMSMSAMPPIMAMFTKHANGGIADIDIDAAEVMSFDTYNSTAQYNQTSTQASIAVASSGLKTLKVRLDGKNASSGDYQLHLQYIVIFRTA